VAVMLLDWTCSNCKKQFVLGEKGGAIYPHNGKGICETCRDIHEPGNEIEQLKKQFELMDKTTALGFQAIKSTLERVLSTMQRLDEDIAELKKLKK
jgi:nitrate/TMAO reductase-like tetraheme cytochrome c subunit